MLDHSLIERRVGEDCVDFGEGVTHGVVDVHLFALVPALGELVLWKDRGEALGCVPAQCGDEPSVRGGGRRVGRWPLALLGEQRSPNAPGCTLEPCGRVRPEIDQGQGADMEYALEVREDRLPVKEGDGAAGEPQREGPVS